MSILTITGDDVTVDGIQLQGTYAGSYTGGSGIQTTANRTTVRNSYFTRLSFGVDFDNESGNVGVTIGPDNIFYDIKAYGTRIMNVAIDTIRLAKAKVFHNYFDTLDEALELQAVSDVVFDGNTVRNYTGNGTNSAAHPYGIANISIVNNDIAEGTITSGEAVQLQRVNGAVIAHNPRLSSSRHAVQIEQPGGEASDYNRNVVIADNPYIEIIGNFGNGSSWHGISLNNVTNGHVSGNNIILNNATTVNSKDYGIACYSCTNFGVYENTINAENLANASYPLYRGITIGDGSRVVMVHNNRLIGFQPFGGTNSGFSYAANVDPTSDQVYFYDNDGETSQGKFSLRKDNTGHQIMFYASSLTGWGTWNIGDRFDYSNPAAGGQVGKVATVAGTDTAISTTGGITINTPTLVVASATGLHVNQYLTIAGVSGIKQITALSGTTVTLDTNAGATVVGAAVANSPATWKTFGLPSRATRSIRSAARRDLGTLRQPSWGTAWRSWLTLSKPHRPEVGTKGPGVPGGTRRRTLSGREDRPLQDSAIAELPDVQCHTAGIGPAGGGTKRVSRSPTPTGRQLEAIWAQCEARLR